jgi:hypothetical protein
LAQDDLYQRHIHKTNVTQLHGLNMTPMSIEQLRVASRQNSKRTQYAVKDKTGNSRKTMGHTNKHEGLYLMFVNDGKRMDYSISLQ